MSTVRQSIRDQAILQLNTGPLPDGVPETTKRRYIPGQKIIGPMMAAFFGKEDTTRPGGRGGAITKREFMLALQAAVVVEDPADADDALEPLLAHMTSVMGDTNLGGLATDISEAGTEWGSANHSGVFVLVALVRWKIDYQTVKNDLTKKQ